MRKRLSIIMTGIAVVFILIAVSIHHHHHGEVMYLALQEQCGDQGCGAHHEEDNTTDHTQHYLASSSVRLNAASHADGSHHWLPAFFFLGIAGSPLDCPPPFTAINTGCSHHYARSLSPSWQQHCLGLRAPPCC